MGVSSFSGEHRFLSNFYPADVVGPGGFTYRSVEHAYQASKTLDRTCWVQLRDMASPGQAKAFGKRLPMRQDWGAVKIPEMRKLLVQKFAPGSPLTAMLAATSGPIEEGNAWGDKFWGVDLASREGRNELGKLLMEIRGAAVCLCGHSSREHDEADGGCSAAGETCSPGDFCSCRCFRLKP